MEENAKCYRFEKITNAAGFLEKSISATYIIYLNNNGRLPDIKTQLAEYQPSKTIYIVFNQGYKKCNKNKYINGPARDLIDAYLQIFKHARTEKYQNILILEDDFIFDPKIKDTFHQDNINSFVNKYQDTKFIYYIGCIPILQIPYDYFHNILVLAMGAHSIIYSKTYREYVLNHVSQTDIIDWDVFMSQSSFMQRYNYYIPLCYQLFPKTENSKTWGIGYGETFSKINVLIFTFFIQLCKLDTQIEPGYPFFYAFSKILFYILLISILAILYTIYNSRNIKLFRRIINNNK